MATNYQSMPLGDVVRFGNGKSIKPGGEGRYPVYGSNGIIGACNDYRHENGIIIGRVGAYCGSVLYCPDRFWASDNTLVAFPYSDAYDTKFLYYLLTDAKLSRHAGGAAQPLVTQTVLKQVEVNVPPLPLQRRIARILSAYDELIENSQRRIKILEAMARALYREWFVHFRFPGHENHPRVDSPLGEIPDGWAGSLTDLVSIAREGINPSDHPGEQFEHFSIPAFDDGRAPVIECGDAILSNKYSIDASCVLLSKLNPRIPRIWLPEPTGAMRAITSTEFLVLKPKAGFTREFVYTACCSEEFAAQFASLAIGTSTSHQRVKPENLLAMTCTVPSHVIVTKFTAFVAPMLGAAEKLRATNRNLRRTRDLLLPRLLSGQIEVDAASATPHA